MSHRWDCPTESEARLRARRDAEHDSEYGWGRRYTSPFDECRHSSEVYRSEYDREWRSHEERREEEAAAHRAAERRREAAEEEENWRRSQEQEQYDRAMEEQYYAQMEEEYATAMADDYREAIVELPRWEDDGGSISSSEVSKE